MPSNSPDMPSITLKKSSPSPPLPRQGLYVHIPFCKSRCIYCDFYSTTRHLDSQDTYTAAVLSEMEQRSGELPQERLDTIYIGGGTPSVFSEKNLGRIISGAARHWHISPKAEITVEANPDDITPAYAASLNVAGVNRVSMGAQTFDDSLLRLLGRRHTARQVVEAINHLHHAGIHNISIDLIYGLPNQSLDMWKHDLQQAFALPVSHLSAYALIYEDNTPLYRLRETGRLTEADDELELSMYQTLIDETQAHGFRHYEISNFALPTMEARHNSGYWAGMRYLGLGPAAHSYNGITRRWNLPSLSNYISANGHTGITPKATKEVWTHPDHIPMPTDTTGKIGEEQSETALYGYEHLTTAQRKEEMLLTRMRTAVGLDIEAYAAAFGNEAARSLLARAQPYINSGKILQKDHRMLCLTREGLFLSDGIIANLFEE